MSWICCSSVINAVVALLAIAASLVVWNFSYLRSIWKLLTMMFIARSHDKKHKNGKYSFLDSWEDKVDHTDKGSVQFIANDQATTVHMLEELANQVGNWGLSKGLQQRDTVGLMLLNSPDFVAIWLGFGKIGVSTALLNTNLTGNAFVHSCEVSLKSSGTKILIVDAELASSLSSDLTKIKALGISVVFWSAEASVKSAKDEVTSLGSSRIPKTHRETIKESDALLYIFTSGTTGLPKACKISNTRMFLSCIPYRVLCDLSDKDRVYTVLPLYHSGGGMLGVGAVLMSGATMVLRKKFSASNFAADCVKYRITSFQYIGELCRYLIAIPPTEAEKLLNTVRTAYGNGMRPEVWQPFQQRYHIKHIVEFYGATEGNASLFNCFDKVGALGHIPPLLDGVYPLKIIRTEPEDQTKPLRDSRGRCVPCKDGEVGLLVSQIFANRKFEGYSDAKATNDKILKDVLKEGDSFFNTGDLLSRDPAGFYFWSDRIGDTFRWKGENVATTEVSEVLAGCRGVKDVTVFGVSVSGCDGKAGMAAIAIHTSTEGVAAVSLSEMLSDIVVQSKANLPSYSRPLFLRVKVDGQPLETTSTFKHVKGALVTEGYNPVLVRSDALFYFSSKSDAYLPINSEVFKQINDQHIRL